ncbi:MAG: hypothetical protein AMXMBFR34_07620 [Myxococcaceae bacterium]
MHADDATERIANHHHHFMTTPCNDAQTGPLCPEGAAAVHHRPDRLRLLPPGSSVKVGVTAGSEAAHAHHCHAATNAAAMPTPSATSAARKLG